jgi:signal transduction histidine kinase
MSKNKDLREKITEMEKSIRRYKNYIKILKTTIRRGIHDLTNLFPMPMIYELLTDKETSEEAVDDLKACLEENYLIAQKQMKAILKFTGYDKVTLESFSLKHFLEQMEKSCSLSHPEIKITIHTENRLIKADRRMLFLVFNNLINNAAKHGAPMTEITIFAYGDNKSLHFVVQDNGTGIDPILLPKIFGLGVKSKNSHGLGLGLANVKKTVEAHKGKIWADSEVGKGATFTIIIPQ